MISKQGLWDLEWHFIAVSLIRIGEKHFVLLLVHYFCIVCERAFRTVNDFDFPHQDSIGTDFKIKIATNELSNITRFVLNIGEIINYPTLWKILIFDVLLNYAQFCPYLY